MVTNAGITSEAIEKIIGENVFHFRKMRNLSQEELGRRIGSGQRHISKIEKGSNITSITLIKLASALEVSMDDLIFADHREEMVRVMQEINSQGMGGVTPPVKLA